jgi:hypothetical protein
VPTLQYCGRCKKEVPFLNQFEAAQLEPMLAEMVTKVQLYRRDHGASLADALAQGFDGPPLRKYYQLTGYRETEVKVLQHHFLDRYGPPCRNCGRLLMTRAARFCAQCGATV